MAWGLRLNRMRGEQRGSEATARLLGVKFVKWTNSDDRIASHSEGDARTLFRCGGATSGRWIRELFDARGALDKTLREIAQLQRQGKRNFPFVGGRQRGRTWWRSARTRPY